jgi:hypothetical protein
MLNERNENGQQQMNDYDALALDKLTKNVE